MSLRLPVFYDCGRCPAYCCTYPQIPVTLADERRLAEGLGRSVEQVRRSATKKGHEPGTRVLRHRPDPIFSSACRFLDVASRRCTVYDFRPQACREYPGTVRCGYYDFLSSERRRQDDPDLVVCAWVADVG